MLYLLDASIYFFRAWFAMPDRWQGVEGHSLNGVYGYLRFLLAWLDRSRPEWMAAAFDESLETGFRHSLYPGYKASRALPDADLAFQLEACRALTRCLGILEFASDTYEADDLLATLAARGRRKGLTVCVLSRDKDLGQVLRPGDRLTDPGGDLDLDMAGFALRFGIHPQQLPDYLALVGDVADDLPGVPGIGAKRAAALLTHFGSLEALLARLDEVPALGLRGAAGIARNLQAHADQARLVRQLAQVVETAPMTLRWPQMRWRAPSRVETLALLRALGFGPGVERDLTRVAIWREG